MNPDFFVGVKIEGLNKLKTILRESPTKLSARVQEVVLKGRPLIVRHSIPEEYLPYYALSEKIPALPKVYRYFQTINEKGAVLMEKLLPFQYDPAREDEYYQAIESIWHKTDFQNMDICPENVMMRADGQIVFISLWKSSPVLSVYFADRSKDPVRGIRASLARTLFFFKHRADILLAYKNKIEEIRAIFPDTNDVLKIYEARIILSETVDDSAIDIGHILKVQTALKICQKAKTFLEDQGKTISEFRRSHFRSTGNNPFFESELEYFSRTIKISAKEAFESCKETNEELTRLFL